MRCPHCRKDIGYRPPETISDDSECPLCGEVLLVDDDSPATTDPLLPPASRNWFIAATMVSLLVHVVHGTLLYFPLSLALWFGLWLGVAFIVSLFRRRGFRYEVAPCIEVMSIVAVVGNCCRLLVDIVLMAANR